MKRTILAMVLTILAAPAADAGINLLQVPAPCGTLEEVKSLLSVKMPTSEEIGRGGDKRGVPIATLLTGNGYWALVATMSPNQVCVVASGHDWTVTGPIEARSY